MTIKNTDYKIPSNKLLAAVWFLLSALIALSSVAALRADRPLMVISMLFFAFIISLMGCQRTKKLRLPDNKFNTLARNTAFAVVLLNAFSILLSG